MDLVFAIGPSRVITHRVPLHGEFSVRLLDLVLVGVPLEPEDVVEVLASAAAPHVSRLLVKRFPPIGRVFLFLLPPSRPSRRGEPAGNAWAEPTREARYGGRRVLKAVRARGGRRCVRWVCATPPRSPLLPARPRKKSVALVPVRSWQWTAAASKKRTFIHGRDTRAREALGRAPDPPSRDDVASRGTHRRARPGGGGRRRRMDRVLPRLLQVRPRQPRGAQARVRGEPLADPRRPRECGVPRKVRR